MRLENRMRPVVGTHIQALLWSYKPQQPPFLLLLFLLPQTNPTTSGLSGTRHHFTAQLRDSGMQHTLEMVTLLSMRI